MKKTARWQKGEWRRRIYEYKGKKRVAEGYEIDYLINGQIQASFIGVPDFNYGVFRLRAMIRFRYAEHIPKTRELPFGEEGKSFEIDV